MYGTVPCTGPPEWTKRKRELSTRAHLLSWQHVWPAASPPKLWFPSMNREPKSPHPSVSLSAVLSQQWKKVTNTASLFIIANTQRKSRLSFSRWMEKRCYIQTMEYYSCPKVMSIYLPTKRRGGTFKAYCPVNKALLKGYTQNDSCRDILEKTKTVETVEKSIGGCRKGGGDDRAEYAG